MLIHGQHVGGAVPHHKLRASVVAQAAKPTRSRLRRMVKIDILCADPQCTHLMPPPCSCTALLDVGCLSCWPAPASLELESMKGVGVLSTAPDCPLLLPVSASAGSAYTGNTIVMRPLTPGKTIVMLAHIMLIMSLARAWHLA